MAKNVLLPLDLVSRLIELLGYWDTSGYDRAIRDEYDCVLRMLNLKLQKLELRAAYSKIVTANDDNERDLARIDYLWQRNHIRNFYEDDSQA